MPIDDRKYSWAEFLIDQHYVSARKALSEWVYLGEHAAGLITLLQENLTTCILYI